MTSWKQLAGEHVVMYSPVGFRLVDEFTTREPLGRITAALDLMVSVGIFVRADVVTRITPSARRLSGLVNTSSVGMFGR